MGGLRRRRESTLTVAFDLAPLDSVTGLRRLLDVTVADALGLDNGLGRLRVLIAAVTAGARLLEVRDLEARVEVLEATERARRRLALAEQAAKRRARLER